MSLGYTDCQMNLRRIIKHLFKDQLLKVRSIRYKGEKYHCPLCNFSASQFLGSPDGERTNVRCPRCSSLERHRAQWIFALSELEHSGNDHFSILHFSPEFCLSSKFFKIKSCDYKTACFSSTTTDYIIDIQNIRLDSESFDFVICNHILEHVENDRLAMSELCRILKPGGKAFIQVPLDNDMEKTIEDSSIKEPMERARIFGQEDHLRLYGRDIVSRLSDSGFMVNYIEYWKQYPVEKLNYYCLGESEPVIICQKS